MVLAITGRTFGQRPSSLLDPTGRLAGRAIALDLDKALAVRLRMAELEQQQAHESGGPYARLDAVLAGRGPRTSPEGLRYEDPIALARAEMDRVRREGLVH